MMLFCLLSLLLLACGEQTVRHQKIFRYNEVSGLATLDPAFARSQAIMWPVHQLFNTLLETDSLLGLKGSLASTWTVTADKMCYTFQLRSDVYFHDDPAFGKNGTRRLKAKDVAFSFTRLINPKTASPGAWIFNNIVAADSPFVAVNDTVFQIRLSKPYALLPALLTMPYCSILPEEAVLKYGADFGRHPVGTGPFRYVAWQEGQLLVLKKNERYFETDAKGNRLPYLEGVNISFLESRAAEFLAFSQGELDFINDLDPSFKDEMLTRTGKLRKAWVGKIAMEQHPYLNTEYLGVLMKDSINNVSPLQNKWVRKALSYSIDRKKMILFLRNNIGTPALHGFAPDGFPSVIRNDDQGTGYDTAIARRLLLHAGYGPGHPMPPITLVTVPNYAAMGSFLVNELSKAGFNIQLEVIQKTVLLEKMSASQVAFFRGSWIADFPDALNFMSVFYSKHPAPPNYTRYHNAHFDSLYEYALSETEISKRSEACHQMEVLLMEDLSVIPLWYDKVIHLRQLDVKGFHPNAQNMLELRHVEK